MPCEISSNFNAVLTTNLDRFGVKLCLITTMRTQLTSQRRGRQRSGLLSCILASLALVFPTSCSSFVVPRHPSRHATPVSTTRQHAATDASVTATTTAAESHDEDHAHHGLQPSYDAKTFTQMRKYEAEHARSIANPSAFWRSKAEHFLDWEQPFQSVMDGTLTDGDVTWFQGGKLNVCYNAIDRHVQNGRANQVAMIWEGDEPGDVVRFTYRDLQH